MSKVLNRSLQLVGERKIINGVSMRVLRYDHSNQVLEAFGAGVPTATSAGFAVGCQFTLTTNGLLYTNTGTIASCAFTQVNTDTPDNIAITAYNFLIGNASGVGAASTAIGTTGTHIVNATAGGTALSIFMDPTAVDGARFNTLLIESLIGATTTFTTQGFGLYTIRGSAGVKTGITFKGTSNQAYLAGVQGKLQNLGVIGDGNSGGIYACAGLSQTSGAGTWGADAQWYGHWIDVQSGVTSLPATSHFLNLTNNSAATVANAIMLYGKVTNFATISVAGSGGSAAVVGAGSIGSNYAGYLKIVVEGSAYKIPFIS